MAYGRKKHARDDTMCVEADAVLIEVLFLFMLA